MICAGRVPTNPVELLSSARMEKLIERLRRNYDYIIMDLPPVNVVSDAIAVSRLLDGVVMVVRNEYSDKKYLAEAMRQLSMVNMRILGFVYRDTGNGKKKYGYRYRYSKKYYNYYSSYGKK